MVWENKESFIGVQCENCKAIFSPKETIPPALTITANPVGRKCPFCFERNLKFGVFKKSEIL